MDDARRSKASGDVIVVRQALHAAGADLRGATVKDVQSALEAMRSKEDGSPDNGAPITLVSATLGHADHKNHQRLRPRSAGREFGAILEDEVGRILGGTKSAELPIERPARFELVVNLKAAKTLGVAVPEIILAPPTR